MSDKILQCKTHAQKVCALYKAGLRQLESYYSDRRLVRYQQVMLRAYFDCNKYVCDVNDMRKLLAYGERCLFNTMHPTPVAKFPRSVGLAGGVAYGREVVTPDWVLDYWHPLEKAQYPNYFFTRECRKCEFIKHWYAGNLC